MHGDESDTDVLAIVDPRLAAPWYYCHRKSNKKSIDKIE